MQIIGLTGGIGSGKTTVSDKFIELGVEVIDADVISRESLAPGAALVTKVVEVFSKDILDESKTLLTIDRKKLRSLIFDDSQARQKLENLVHPAVRESIQKALKEAAQKPYIILSSPLLFETQQDVLTDKSIVVDIPQELQLKRTTQRDSASADELKKIIATQMPREEKLAKSTYRIDNSGSLENTYKQVIMLHNMLMSQS